MPRRDRRDRRRRSRARHLSQPDRDHHGRADARCLFVDRHAAACTVTGRSASTSRARRRSTARATGPRLRDRHQLQSLHRLRHGREHHDDADAGDGARRLRPQPLLQEQLPVPAVDRRESDPRLPLVRQGLYRRVRGTVWGGDGRGCARFRARADGAGRLPLSGAAPVARGARGARASSGASTRRRPTTSCGARCRARRAEDAAGPDPEGAARGKRGAAASRGEPALLPREALAEARGLAARAPAHRAHARAVLLSAAADQGDERRLRHLRPLPDHEPALRQGPDHRRLDARIPAQPYLGGLPAALRRPPLLRPQSLCARLRDDARHQAHLREPDRRGPRLVSRDRRQRRSGAGR